MVSNIFTPKYHISSYIYVEIIILYSNAVNISFYSIDGTGYQMDNTAADHLIMLGGASVVRRLQVENR